MKITIALGGDWDGLYIDDDLKVQGHSLDLKECLTWIMVAAKPITSVETRVVNPIWMDDQDDLPVKIGDIKWEAFT